jgi:hypothetical protein
MSVISREVYALKTTVIGFTPANRRGKQVSAIVNRLLMPKQGFKFKENQLTNNEDIAITLFWPLKDSAEQSGSHALQTVNLVKNQEPKIRK